MAKKVTREELQVTLNGAAEEFQQIANQWLASYFSEAGETIEATIALPDFEQDIDDAYQSLAETNDGEPERRAALLRLGASVIKALAVDEHVRGSKECERIEKRLTPYGYLDRIVRSSRKKK